LSLRAFVAGCRESGAAAELLLVARQARLGPVPAGTAPKAMNRLEKSSRPINADTMGMIRSPTIESTILPNAPPMITPTAKSITLPRMAKALNSCNMQHL
jgi:hypothetical protein